MPPLTENIAPGLLVTDADRRPAPIATAQAGPVLLNGWQRFVALRRIRWHLLKLILRHTPNPLKAYVAIRRLIAIRRQYLGKAPVSKMARIAGRYYYEYNTPGWPSQAFDDFHLGLLNRVAPFRHQPFHFKNVIMAITKKCALRCAHCYEWDALNKKETLSAENLLAQVQKFQDLGVGQLQFSGGEPLLRMPLLLTLLQAARAGTDFWILTSGHLLTLENARALKQAGLTGVSISLDHTDPARHNQFRGFAQAYDWVVAAAANARQAGLVVALSLCATKDFVSEANLMHYARLAGRLGATFIQLLEPKAVGHFAGQQVALPPAQQQMLEDFYLRLNHDPACRHLPMAVYYDYMRRRGGCAAAADRHVYVDTDGQLHACPFCQKPAGKVLDKDFETVLQSLRQAGCPALASSLSFNPSCGKEA